MHYQHLIIMLLLTSLFSSRKFSTAGLVTKAAVLLLSRSVLHVSMCVESASNVWLGCFECVLCVSVCVDAAPVVNARVAQPHGHRPLVWPVPLSTLRILDAGAQADGLMVE
jgi:hypothetical protein